MLNPSSIGVFDSGIGGLTVLQQLMLLLPNEHFIYFGDLARVPYGNKSRETIIRYSIENTIHLIKKNIKLLVVACNTASAYALTHLQDLFQLPIVGVIEAGAKKASAVSKKGRIAVLGTKGTISSGAYQRAIQKFSPQAEVFPIACPLFVPLVEEQWMNHPASRLIVEEYLNPIKNQKVDTVLLGCTHYPFLRTLIQETVGEEVILVDSATTCAQQAADLLVKMGLNSSHRQCANQYFVSDEPERFRCLAESLFGCTIPEVGLLT